jgi:toxin CcdB
MSQFDIYINKGRNKGSIPYLLDVQSDLLSSSISTRIIVPLYLHSLIKHSVIKLHVPVSIKKTKLIAIFDELAAVDLNFLQKPITNISASHSSQLKTALDVLFFNYP